MSTGESARHPLPHLGITNSGQGFLKSWKVPVGARHPANVDHPGLLVGSLGKVRPAVRAVSLRCLSQTFQLWGDRTRARAWSRMWWTCCVIKMNDWGAIDPFPYGSPRGFVGKPKTQLKVHGLLLLSQHVQSCKLLGATAKVQICCRWAGSWIK